MRAVAISHFSQDLIFFYGFGVCFGDHFEGKLAYLEGLAGIRGGILLAWEGSRNCLEFRWILGPPLGDPRN